MRTRRDVLQWVLEKTTLVTIAAGCRQLGTLLGEAHAMEANENPSMETWMNEWMSASKAPGGMLQFSRFREPLYFLIAPITWTPERGQEAYQAVTIPTGFVTDFASIPQVFYSLLRPDGEYAYAAVVHDYLYWTQTRSREEADQILKMAMEDFKIDQWKLSTIYNAVRLGGGQAWKTNAEKKSRGEKRILAHFPQDPRTTWDEWKRRPGVFAP